MNNRISKYEILYNKLKYMTTDQLIEIFNNGKISDGVGKNSVTKINNIDVFIKKIPCTTLEYNNLLNTSNLYNLPCYYNYGVGSVGINCFRELSTHIKTTRWVLDNKIKNFPIMYHYRIIKINNSTKNKEIIDKIDKMKIYWNNNENIKKYLIDREEASYEIMIILEYFPNVLYKWLEEKIENIYLYEKQIYPILNFLYDNNIIHFDTHDANILISNDNTLILTDFGLVLDLSFDLTYEEIKFFNKNTYYDYGLALSTINNPLLWMSMYSQNKIHQKWFDDKYNFKLGNSISNRKIIYKNLNEIFNYLKLNNKYKNIVKKYKNIELIFHIFIKTMRNNDNKDTIFPNNKIKKLC